MIGIEVKIDNNYAYVTLNYRHIVENNWFTDLKYVCEPTENHTKRYCVKFTCSRAISLELVRHKILCVA